MKSYEALVALHPKLEEEKVKAIIEKLEKKIKSTGGEVDRVDRWGKKKTAFSFRKAKDVDEAHYVLINFKGTKDTARELEGLMNLTEEIIRSLVVKSEGPPPLEMAPVEEAPPEKVEIAPSMLEKGPESKESG